MLPEDIYSYIKEPKKKLLFHNTVLLDDDDTSIACISNGDIFKIDEYLDVEISLSETLLLKYINSELINIKCQKCRWR